MRAAGFVSLSTQDRGEALRELITERYTAFVAADANELGRRFGITDHDYFAERFALTRIAWDSILAQDVIWGMVSAQKPKYVGHTF